MPETTYSVIKIRPEWVLEREALGSKEKFWYRSQDDEQEWLFKYPQPKTGQHWAEKIAAELAKNIGVVHAKVELAVFQGRRGSVTESFVHHGHNLFHGNQILAGQVLGYDPARKFRQPDHTLANIFLALDKVFVDPADFERAKMQFASYLVLDALIGNTDRHHENWGILRKSTVDEWKGTLAPSFDHASSLGRELLDTSEGKCRQRLLMEKRIGDYVEKATGAIYWSPTDKRGLSPLELVRRGTEYFPHFQKPLEQVRKLDRQRIESILSAIPDDWMTPIAREFAIKMLYVNLEKLELISS